MASNSGSDGDSGLSLTNRKSTIYGAVITFQVIATLAVALRIYARLRLTKSFGWDDLFVCLALLTGTVGTIFVCLATNSGMGHHMADIAIPELAEYLLRFYVLNATFAMSATFIKMSLVFQYLRIFNEGRLRLFCIVMLCLLAVWGFVFAFMSWFPCFPPRAFWDLTYTGPRHCYAFGASNDEAPFVSTFEAETATNFVWDVVVLSTPFVVYVRRKMTRREITAVVSLSVIGASVICLSAAHLGTVVIHRAAWKPYKDFTYWATLSVVVAAIEVALAILAASIPIFWPAIEADLGSIFVTQEVKISHHQRLDDHDVELNASSTRSVTESETALAHAHTLSSGAGAGAGFGAATDEYFKDPYIAGLKNKNGTNITQVETTVPAAAAAAMRKRSLELR